MKNRLHVQITQDGTTIQADLAEALRVSRQTVNAIENERYDPSLPLAFAIARVFALRIEDVFTPDAEPPPPSDEPPE